MKLENPVVLKSRKSDSTGETKNSAVAEFLFYRLFH